MYSRLISFTNKLLDYLKFDSKRNIRKKLIQINSDKDISFFDYGVGYFYQSSFSLNIRGLRDSKYRKDLLDISRFTKDKNLLDIGTNSGFLLIYLENNYNYAIGIDYNPQLIKVANEAKNFLKIQNIDFQVKNFQVEKFDEKFDVIFSLANHDTYDKGITLTENYFNKIDNLLNLNGILVLEGHHPQIESDEKFIELINLLNKKFEIVRRGKYKSNNFFDNGRNFVILKKFNHQ